MQASHVTARATFPASPSPSPRRVAQPDAGPRELGRLRRDDEAGLAVVDDLERPARVDVVTTGLPERNAS